MRDVRKDIKHALQTAVLLVTILFTTLVTVGTAYATDDGTLGVTTATVSTSRFERDDRDFKRPVFDDDRFFRPRVDPFFRFNPFFDDDFFFFDDDFGFEREDD